MRNAVIIGSGCAGLTAAIYTARANLSPLVIRGVEAGGQLSLTTLVENFPGFPDGVLGPELMERMRKQAERFGPDIIFDDATAVDFRNRPFTVTVSGKTHSGRAVIVATGALAKWLGIASETKFRGKGVSTCATCDGYFFKEKNVVVVGGGDTAMEEATFLANVVRHVTVVHRRDTLRASGIMQERAMKNPKIDFLLDSVVEEVLGLDKVTGVKTLNLKTGKESVLKTDGLFVAIGYQPNTEIFKGQLHLDDRGYIRTKAETETNIAGVFAAGDVRDHKYRQAVTAAADGCKAAMDADRFLSEHND